MGGFRWMLLSVLAACLPRVSTVPVGTTTPPLTPVPTAVPTPVVETEALDVPQPKVDVLFVVDNSSSMGEEQGRLSASFPALIAQLDASDVDFHVGIVATDIERPAFSGKLREADGERFVTPTTPDPLATLEGMVDALGVLVGSNEAGRGAAWMALETQGNSYNAGFSRDEAELQIVFVSDANDETGANPLTRGEFLQWAGNLKEPVELLTMHAIAVLQSDTGCSSTRVGIDYIEYATVSGGQTQSICAVDWSPMFDSLSVGESGAGQRFFLGAAAVPESVVVDVDTTTYTPCPTADSVECVRYRADDNSFDLPGIRVAADASVDVSYTVL